MESCCKTLFAINFKYVFEGNYLCMISVKQTFKLYEVVNKYFQNSEDSKVFVAEIEDIMDNRIELKNGEVASKADISDVRVEIADVRVEISDVRLEISELRVEMARGFKEQLKWILILMVSYMSITVAIIKLL